MINKCVFIKLTSSPTSSYTQILYTEHVLASSCLLDLFIIKVAVLSLKKSILFITLSVRSFLYRDTVRRNEKILSYIVPWHTFLLNYVFAVRKLKYIFVIGVPVQPKNHESWKDLFKETLWVLQPANC